MAKEGLAIMLGVPKDKGKPASGGGGLKEAARDMLDAVADNDEVALATALRIAYAACAEEHEAEDNEDDTEA